ncbi:MAG: hypothetical protein GY950_10505 [bacterium]|nr:hypothetical protein [bacterium]
MSEGKIFYNNLIQGSTVSLVPEDTSAEGFGIEYIGNNNQGVVWRSDDISERFINMSFKDENNDPLDVTVYGVVVMNHNLESGDTFRIEASGSGFSTIDETRDISVSTGFLDLTDLPTPESWTYPDFRLRLQKTSGNYIQVGEIYLIGGVYQFDRNYSWNYSFTKEINRNSKETTSGQVYRKTRFIRKGFALDFEGMNDTQKEKFEEISESDYVCFLPTGSGGDLHFGIIDFSSYTHVYSDYWTANINFTENPK